MQITQLKLKNFRQFGDITILFTNRDSTPSTVVFIGNNGAGKTTIFDALTLSLSWLVARICREKGVGNSFSEIDILNGENQALVDLEVNCQNIPYRWVLSKTRRGRVKSVGSQLVELTKLASSFRTQLTQYAQISLPLIISYPVERIVIDIPLKIKTRHSFGQLDGYDNSLQQGVDFRRFFEWFRDREDAENERQVKCFTEAVNKAKMSNANLPPGTSFQDFQITMAEYVLSDIEDHQLEAVRLAIKSFMPEFDNLHVQRKPRLKMIVEKQGKTLDVAQLSQGEKSLMALVGDIARRLAIMNPSLDNPLEGYGIILIDEIDMHLHPTWQRAIIGNLNKTFPNCQFILTTHSPIVISESPHLLCYALNDGILESLPNLYGSDVNQVLLRDMNAEIRNVEIQSDFDNLRDHIHEGHLEEAKQLLHNLETKIEINHIELNKARLLIHHLEIRRA